jgi:hypothetical protein
MPFTARRFPPSALRARILVSVIAAAALALAACGGESKSDKAQKQVCSARADIQKQVNTLTGLTPTTATVDGVKNSLGAIGDDLKTIAGAQGDLNDERKKQVQAANDQFSSEFTSIVASVGTGISISDAGTKLKAAAQELSAAYQKSFAKVDCS